MQSKLLFSVYRSQIAVLSNLSYKIISYVIILSFFCKKRAPAQVYVPVAGVKIYTEE